MVRTFTPAFAALAALLAAAVPAHADLQICSRMSYVVEAAIARTADATPGVTVRRGVAVKGLLTGESVVDGVPHVLERGTHDGA